MKQQNRHLLLSKQIKNQLQDTQTHVKIINGLKQFVETLSIAEKTKIRKSRNSHILLNFLECDKMDLGKQKCMGTAVQNYCDQSIEKISRCFMSNTAKNVCSSMVTQYFQCAAKVGKKLYVSSVLDY